MPRAVWMGALFVVAVGCGDDRRAGGDAGVPPAVDAGVVRNAPYEVCVNSPDCEQLEDQCVEVSIPEEGTFGGFCSRFCESDLECPERGERGGVCYGLEGAAPVCFQQCDLDTDCAPSSVCIEVGVGAGLVDFVCVPQDP